MSRPLEPSRESFGDPVAPGHDEPTPWGFRIFLVAAVLYLGLRLVQGVIWVVERLL